ncbi:MAG: CvpA family protein [Spirochaetaceae bacterium]|jgi:membrane protein required for colicin V production|nr:CvpA family protein [Spirochaetaceae bacterium]
MSFSALDIAFAILIFLLSLRCFFRGFITELMSMASLVLGLLAAFLFHKPAAAFVMEKWLPGSEILADIIATAALFAIVFVTVKILEHIIQDIISAVNLGGVDRFIGLFFGFAEGVLLATLIVWLISVQPLFDPQPLLESSVIAQILLPLAGSARESLDSV